MPTKSEIVGGYSSEFNNLFISGYYEPSYVSTISFTSYSKVITF